MKLTHAPTTVVALRASACPKESASMFANAKAAGADGSAMKVRGLQAGRCLSALPLAWLIGLF